MTFIHLKSFYYIISLNSLSKAAEKLDYSQSTVSYHIKMLEDNYGILFYKKKGIISLTEIGKLLFDFSEEMIDKEQKLTEKILSTTQDLKIGTIQSISESILVNRISSFRKQFTDTAIKIIIDDENKLLELLENDEVDCIFIFDKKLEISNKYIHHYYEQDFELISLGIKKFDNNTEYRMILTDEKCTYRKAFLKEYGKYNNITITLELENPSSIIQSLNKKNEIAFLPQYVTELLTDKKFNRKKIKLKEPFYLQFLYHPRNTMAEQFYNLSIKNK